MSKVFSVVSYQAITDPQRFEGYAQIAGGAIEASGGRFVARGLPEAVYESGKDQRVVVIEFDTLAEAKDAYESPLYKKALAILGNGAIRDYRIVPAC